jgi:hypothetical protein
MSMENRSHRIVKIVIMNILTTYSYMVCVKTAEPREEFIVTDCQEDQRVV